MQNIKKVHRKPGWRGAGGGGTWHVRKINGIPLYWSLKHWIYFKTTLSIPCLYFSCHSSSYSVSIPMKVHMIVTFPPLFLLICFKLLITQTFFDFPTRFELSGLTVFYLPNQPIRAPEQIRDRLSYQLVWHFCCWGADVSLTKRPSGEIEAWGNGCIRQLYPLEALTKTFLLTIILST